MASRDSPSVASASPIESRGRRNIQPPSRFRTSPQKPSTPLPSSSLNIHRSGPPHHHSSSSSSHAPALPRTKIKISTAASAAAGSSRSKSSRAGSVLPSAEDEDDAEEDETAATQADVLDSGFPSRHNKSRVGEDDLRDKVLMAVCAALASIENKALLVQEIVDICIAKGWIRRSPNTAVSSLVSSAIRSHSRRIAAAGRPSLLSKHVLFGTHSEIHIAPALHPDTIHADRRPKGTVWFLSADAGYWNPFERARVAHLLMKDGEGTRVSGLTSKRKRDEVVGSSSSSSTPAPSSVGGLKIRLKVLGGVKEDSPTSQDVLMAEDAREGSSSHSRSLGSSSSGPDPRLGRGRRQRGPTDRFPDFVRMESSDEDDHSDDQTSTSSLPNHHESGLQTRSRAAPPKPLQARHSLPAPTIARSLPSSFFTDHPHSHRSELVEDSESSSSENDDDFHEAMLRSDDFAFGMDEDPSGDGSGDTPATTPRDGGVDALSDQQMLKPAATSASPPARRSPYPPPPTPAEVLAGGPVPISADPNQSQTREPINSLSSSELSDSNLLRHRLATAPHSPARPFHLDPSHPYFAPTAGGLLALPRMQALSPSPSPSPAVRSALLPHLHFLPPFIAHFSPSRQTFHAHSHLLPGVGSTPNSPSTETKEQDEAFNLTLSLLPGDFKPVSVRENHRFGEPLGGQPASEDEFDDSQSICVIQAEDASPASEASGLFDDFGEVGGRDPSLARSEEDPLRKAEKWALESSYPAAGGGVKVESSSPRMMVLDVETGSPREEEFSRDSSREGDDEGGEFEDEEENASGILGLGIGGLEDAIMEDEDRVDAHEDFLGPESVGLEELERVWGGKRREGERCSPFSFSMGGGEQAVKLEDVEEDASIETVEEVKRAKEAFAQALVDKVRAASAVTMDQDNDDDEMDDPHNPASSAKVSHSFLPNTSSSFISKRRVASAPTSNDPNTTPRPSTFLKKKRRESSLPKPLPAPVRRPFGHKRSNTASVTEMVGMLDFEDFDEMELLFTPESGIGSRRAGSVSRRSESVDASGMSSDVELLGEGETPISGVFSLVDLNATSTSGGDTVVMAPKPPPQPCKSIIAPRPTDLPTVPDRPKLVPPLRPLSPNVSASCVSGIPVFMCIFSNIVLLRRIDSEYVNASTMLEALQIVGAGEEAKKKEILVPIVDHVLVDWGLVGAGVNGIWVPLQVARGLALRFSAGSPLLSTFFDLRLAEKFPSQLFEAATNQVARSPSGFAIPPPRPISASKPSTSSRPPAKPSSLSTSTVPSPVAASKLPAKKMKPASKSVASPSSADPLSFITASKVRLVGSSTKSSSAARTAAATAAKAANRATAAALAAASTSNPYTSSSASQLKLKPKPMKKKLTGTTADLLGGHYSSEEDEESDEVANDNDHDGFTSSHVSSDRRSTSSNPRSTRRMSRIGDSK